MTTPLKGKYAIVCGASAGIGRACARALAELGASVSLVARRRDVLEAVAADLPTHGGLAAHRAIVADLSNPAASREAIAAAMPAGGVFHILVNNTGGPPAGAMLDATPDALRTAFESLLVTPHVLAQLLVPGMQRAGYGRIINIQSTSVKQPIPNLGLSNAVRAAVANWAKSLSMELGPAGITVNNVLPGYTDTERLGELFSNRAAKTGRAIDDIRRDVVATIPAGRLGAPEEIAAAVAFLASPAAAYVNGINLPVDGGRLSTL
ncbi:MAG: SDR family oxidoreductase [Phycisphaeraceae bacterium]|nr:SDR family oxidoreductase [Phycisphaeraceae bacterium]